MSIIRRFVCANAAMCAALDRRLPVRLSVDGNRDYIENVVWRYIGDDQLIYDIGGGKQPLLTLTKKRELGCQIVGVDISESELEAAPCGVYDRIVVADISTYEGNQDADIVICQALLEHVPDTQAALLSIASILKRGGILVLFVPCRNAAFARLNLLLPESWKRRILFTLFPSTRESQGFRSYYDRCTPEKVLGMGTIAKLQLVEAKYYYTSSYFSFFFPLYLVWRLWTAAVCYLGIDRACETFAMALKKAV
ncbi:MAG: methyltransferase domain-containing protein [Gammaproteobacteria bacterium]|nr:methyltransferase domain-containing protein [Gammaproteobacteria bacterium]